MMKEREQKDLIGGRVKQVTTETTCDYNHWMAKQQRGEVRVFTINVLGAGRYQLLYVDLTLPSEGTAQQEEFFERGKPQFTFEGTVTVRGRRDKPRPSND